VREPHRNDFTELGGEATHDGEGVDLKVSSAFIDHELATRYDATGAFRTAGGSLTAGAFDENKRIKLWVTEGLLTSKAPGRLRWLAGAFASYTDEQDTAALSGVRPPVPPRSIYRRRDRLSEAAVYGEASYDLSARLTATVGGRFFATRVSTYAGDFALAQAPLGPMSGRLIDRGVAPKVRVSYAVTPDAVIYVQAQEGYRAGGFNIPPAAGGSWRPDDGSGMAPPPADDPPICSSPEKSWMTLGLVRACQVSPIRTTNPMAGRIVTMRLLRYTLRTSGSSGPDRSRRISPGSARSFSDLAPAAMAGGSATCRSDSGSGGAYSGLILARIIT